MTDLLSVVFQESILLIPGAIILGLVVGSFLNVVIYRIPVMLENSWRQNCDELYGKEHKPSPPFNLVSPRSRCPHCGAMITATDNIPLLSYLLLKGRCRQCHAPISIRYPLIEALTAAVTVITILHFGYSWQALYAILLTWSLIALSFIDYDTQLLPDNITLPVLWFGLLLSPFNIFVDSQASIFGAAAGYLSLWSIYHLFRLLTGKEGMGYGDFKLLAMLGAWLGWQALPVIILLSSAVGAMLGVSLILFRGHDKRIPIPFGPYLAIAGWITLLWGQQLTRWYLDWAVPT